MKRSELRKLVREVMLELDEANVTGGSATFTPGQGAQYATPNAFGKSSKGNRATKLLKKLGATGVKQSLEDEGVSFQDIKIMRVLTNKIKLKLNVKVGGCEAKNDIIFCTTIKADGIVAPMIESSYALKKFIQTVPK